MATVPHFDMPFRFGSAGSHVAVVEQNTGEDVTNCVETILRTTRGTRLYVPNFGITDPTFSIKPLPTMVTDQMEQEVVENEPRAIVAFTDLGTILEPMVANIIAEVNNE